MDPMPILTSVKNNFLRMLGPNILGIYLHGSIAMGCFTDRSDIDFIAIVKDPLAFSTKRQIVEYLASLGGLPAKGIEMSIILEEHAKHFSHPTPFELHYSPSHKQRYLDDPQYICGGSVDRDLAAHMTVTRERGACIFGVPIKDMFAPIPADDYIDSILYDVKDAKTRILEDKAYMALSLCRVLQFLEQGKVTSKKEAGEWAVESLPIADSVIVARALDEYLKGKAFKGFSEKDLIGFASGMLDRISEERKSLIPRFHCRQFR